MEQVIRQSFEDNDWDLLNQVLHNKSELVEVQYAIGPENFHLFISQFEILTLDQNQGLLELATGNLYYFISGGHIVKKIEKPKQKSKKNINRRAMISSDARSPLNLATTVSKYQLTLIQDLLSSQSRSIGYFFSGKPDCLILKLSQSNIPSSILTKLRGYYSEKLRLLSKLPLLAEIPRNVLQEAIEKFKFMKIYFNDLLYSPTLRSESIFVLVRGEAIIEPQKRSQSIIVKSPNILGDERGTQTEQSRCISQYCICYVIQKKEADQLFQKGPEQIQKQQGCDLAKTTASQLRANFISRRDTVKDTDNEQYDGLNQTRSEMPSPRIDKLESLSQNNRKNKFKIVKQSQDQTSKQQRIKQHFSNFLSMKYKEYSVKAQKSLAGNNQTPVLYKMKSLMPYCPNYKEIQSRLKQIRLNKILQVKDLMSKSSSSSCLLMHRYGDEKSDNGFNSNDGISAKILRNIDRKIATQINKRYGMKMRQL